MTLKLDSQILKQIAVLADVEQQQIAKLAPLTKRSAELRAQRAACAEIIDALPAESERLASTSAAHLLGDISAEDHQAGKDKHDAYRQAVKIATQDIDAIDRALIELTNRIELQQAAIQEARRELDDGRTALIEAAFAADLAQLQIKVEPLVKAFVDLAALSEVLRLTSTSKRSGLGFRPFNAELAITDFEGRLAAILGDGDATSNRAIRKIPKQLVSDRANELAEIINQAGGRLPELHEPTAKADSIANTVSSRDVNRDIAALMAARPDLLSERTASVAEKAA